MNYTLKEYGLKINDEKRIVMRIKEKNGGYQWGHYLTEVEEFVYIDSEINREAKIKKG